MLEWERWTEPLAESNCYLLGEAGHAVVIDPNDPAGPLECLQRRGWSPELIFLTHEHCDHMAGLETLRSRYPQAKVIATGGMAHMVKSNSSVIDEINPDLTLTGLRIIYEKNQA